MRIVILIIVFLQFWTLSLQQECASSCDLSLTTCTHVNYPIYHDANSNITQSESQAQSIISKVQALSRLVGQECVDQVMIYTCAYLYPYCDNSTGAFVKVKPCVKMCTDVNTACAPFLSLLTDEERQFLDCSQIDPIDNLPFFSDANCYVLDNLEPDLCNSTDPGYKPISGCQMYDPSLAVITSSYCSPFVSSEIFVPFRDPLVQTDLDKLANDTLWEIHKMHPVLTVGCYKALLSLLCQTAFPTCNRIFHQESGYLIEVGSVPCNEHCKYVSQECSLFSDILGRDFINCSMTYANGQLVWPNGPSFPERITKDITVENTCSQNLFPPNSSAQFVLPFIESCPSVLAKKPNPSDKDQPCWIPCPDPTYTSKMWKDLTIIGLFGASVSFVLMLFLILSTILSAKKRNRRIHVCVYLAVLLQSISWFINTTHPEDHVWCDDPVTYANSSNAACGAQAFIFQWFTLSIALWWLIVVFHMYCIIVQRKSVDDIAHYEIFYHILGWVFPLIITIITAAIGSHGFGPPAAWCYIHDPGFTNSYVKDYDNGAGISVDYYVFYIPIGFCLLTAAILMTMIFYYIFKTLRSISDIRSTTRADLEVQQRMLFFVILLFIIFILVCEWRFNLQALDVEKIKHDDFLYVYCQIKNDLGISYSDTCLDEELPYKINYSHTAFETFLASTFGFFIFLAFGTDSTIYHWWWQLSKIKTQKDFVEYIRTETTTSISSEQTTSDQFLKQSSDL